MFARFKTPASIASHPPLTLFSTETRELAYFIPRVPGEVTMYSCGPTVYDYVHIGNLRAYVFVDILQKTLAYNGYKVKNTINLTDFGHLTSDGDAGEDKMMKGLRREGKPITLTAMRELSDFYITAFKNDIAQLRIKSPTTFSRASDYIEEQIALVKTLDEKGYTYETSDGVYFDIAKFPAYGRLGHINVEELRAGARVEENTEKHHPADFAVWKKGLLGWDSRWGKGFPGWHIECSAMAMATLGKEIDIHTGGIDHIHTHHNAEIAQSEAATGKQYVRYWMHNEFITIDHGKIGKSLGNAITLKQIIDSGFSPDDFRYWLLTAHYRSPLNFSFEALKAARQALFRLKRYVYEEYKNASTTPDQHYIAEFHTYINNDLDTPKAIALLFDITKDTTLDAGVKCATIQHIDSVLDIGLHDAIDTGLASLGVVSANTLPDEIETLVTARQTARHNKQWDEADRLRTKLNLAGYIIEDTPQGQKVSKANSN